jgi:carotenoid 1,2-hydratase
MADPANHVCMHAVLYGKGGKRWAMTERGRDALTRDARSLAIGPSAMRWEDGALTVRLEEVTAPIPSRLRGTIRLTPLVPPNPRGFTLDGAGRQRWRPIAPLSRVEVEMESPALRWSGPAYFDTNDGDAPLEEDFRQWDWCRAPLRAGGGAILYNAERRDGTAQALSLRIRPDGVVEDAPLLPPTSLKRSLWGVARPTRADAGAAPRVVSKMEDAPFYTRSVISTRLFGEEATAVHESLDLDRFAALPIQAMLPFRIPRRWW